MICSWHHFSYHNSLLLSLQMEWLNWRKLDQTTPTPAELEYQLKCTSDILKQGDVYVRITEPYADSSDKMAAVIEYLSGRHCLFYSWLKNCKKKFIPYLRNLCSLVLRVKFKKIQDLGRYLKSAC